MREIKFQFLYKGLPYSSVDHGCNWFKKTYTLDQLIDKPLRYLSDVHGQSKLVAKRQFTGLKDKNGVEIYFDDVVVVYGYGNLHVKEMCDLVELYDSAAENDIGEILGNIHENPELLEDDS